MHHRTTMAALVVVAILLVAFLLPSGALMIAPAFAYDLSGTTTVGQHIPNSNALALKSIDFKMNKGSLLTTNTVTVQIKQDGKTLGSADIDARKLSTAYQTITATFSDPVNVTANNYDIVVSYSGKGIVSVLETRDYRAGNMFTGSQELGAYDLIVGIHSETTTSTSSNGGTSSGGSGSTTTATSDGTTVQLRVNAVDQNGKPVNGMWIAILQGMSTLVDKGWTEKTFTLKKNEPYTVFMDSYTNGEATWTFKGWKDSSAGKFRDAKLTGGETFTAIYEVTGPTSSGNTGGTTDNSGGTAGSGTGGSSGNTGGSGGTTTAGANQVAVNSQLLDGTPKTGMAVELREAANGHIAQNSFTPATLDMQPGIEYKAIVYPFEDFFFRHWTDGGLHRYHLVDTDHNSGDTLMAQYEQVPASISAHLMINAKTSSGLPIGGTTGSEEEQNLNAEPGLEVLVAPPGSMNAYTAGFTGGSEIADAFHFAKGKTYTVIAQEYGQYKFSHWEDNGFTNRARAVPLNGDLTLTAIYDVVS